MTGWLSLKTKLSLSAPRSSTGVSKHLQCLLGLCVVYQAAGCSYISSRQGYHLFQIFTYYYTWSLIYAFSILQAPGRVRINCYTYIVPTAWASCSFNVDHLMTPLLVFRSQYWQFVPHGRWSGPGHGVAGQRDDGRAERRTARGPAFLMLLPTLLLSHAFLVKTTGLENRVYKENI